MWLCIIFLPELQAAAWAVIAEARSPLSRRIDARPVCINGSGLPVMVLGCHCRKFDVDALRVVVRAVFSVQRKFCGREERKDCQMAGAPIGQGACASK
jgi:hypothetical protein